MNLDLQLMIIAIPIVMGMVEILKLAGIRSTLAPIFALICGVLIAVGFGIDERWTTIIVTGLAIGAAASGTYDYTKALAARLPIGEND